MKKSVLLGAMFLVLVLAGCGSYSSGDDIYSGDADVGTDASGTPRSDKPAEEPDATPHTATEEEILDFDAPFYAREFNVSIEEAKRRLVRQNELGPSLCGPPPATAVEATRTEP